MARQVIVEYGQSLVDICIECEGTADALSAICELNNLEYDADLHPGQVLLLPELNPDNDIQQYYIAQGIRVNSHHIPGDIELLGTNDEEVFGDDDDLIGV